MTEQPNDLVIWFVVIRMTGIVIGSELVYSEADESR